MGKTNKCNSREDETLAGVKNTVCMIKVFPDIKKGVKMLGKLLRKRLVLKKVVIVNF